MIGFIFIASIVVVIAICATADDTKHTQPVDEVKRIADLQSWEFVRGLNKDASKR